MKKNLIAPLRYAIIKEGKGKKKEGRRAKELNSKGLLKSPGKSTADHPKTHIVATADVAGRVDVADSTTASFRIVITVTTA